MLLHMCRAERSSGGGGVGRSSAGSASALVEQQEAPTTVAAAASGSGSGYDAKVETYRKPPRWLKNLETEEDETRVLNYGINLALVTGTFLVFGYKFFAIDADLWRGWTLLEILSADRRLEEFRGVGEGQGQGGSGPGTMRTLDPASQLAASLADYFVD